MCADDPGTDFMTVLGQCQASDSSSALQSPYSASLLSPQTSPPLLPPVAVYLHYADNVYLKITASVAVLPSSLPDSFAPRPP
jgi:hypothetical protein